MSCLPIEGTCLDIRGAGAAPASWRRLPQPRQGSDSGGSAEGYDSRLPRAKTRPHLMAGGG